MQSLGKWIGEVGAEAWSLEEWNAALVRQVFLAPSRARASMSRIDATGRLLGKLPMDDGGDQAKQSFISAFGGTAAKIRQHFKWSHAVEARTQRDGIPPCFAALYLSLLAASADDNTFSEGQFRSRFAKLVRVPELKNFSFSDLPRLWAHVATWSRQRAEAKGDCTRLVLPDPGAWECIIGHSKRLAFPTFRDETSLRRLLRDEGLGSHSDFAAVSNAVHRSLKEFGESFKEEFRAFTGLVVKASFQEAYDTPFWGAVRDITREEEAGEGQAGGLYCVQLDASDPLQPELILLSNEAGLAPLDTVERTALRRPRGCFTHRWLLPFHSPSSMERLVHLATSLDDLRKSRIGRSLEGGCLALLPDELDALSSDGESYHGGPVGFLLRQDLVGEVLGLASHLGLRAVRASLVPGARGWVSVMLLQVSQSSLIRLASALPEPACKWLTTGWRPPRPRIVGAARLGQAILLSPASNPLVRMEGATVGRFALVGVEGQDACSGKLSVRGGDFYIPPTYLASLCGDVHTCLYALAKSDGEEEAFQEVAVLPGTHTKGFRPLASPESWLVDGQDGTLAALGTVAPSAGHQQPRGSRVTDLQPLVGGWPLIMPATEEKLAHCVAQAIDEWPGPMQWLADALLLRFQGRQTLSFDELQSHLEMLAEATGIRASRVRRLLLNCGWVWMLTSRTVPHHSIAVARRFISHRMAASGAVEARISGMLSMHEQRLLLGSLLPGESAWRLIATGMVGFVGAIQLHLSSPERASLLAQLLGLQQIREGEAGNPLGGLVRPLSQIDWIAQLPQELPLDEWHTDRWEWIPLRTPMAAHPHASIFRSKGHQRTTYFVGAQDGAWKTDSEAWARLLGCIAGGGSLGTMATNGDVAWPGTLSALPPGLPHWWMHCGGGSIGIDGDGRLTFVGSPGRSAWADIAYSAGQVQRRLESPDIAVIRRKLALKLRRRKDGQASI